MADLTDDQLDHIEARYREWSPDWRELDPDAAALVDEVRRLRRLERIKDRVGLDLDAQLSEVIAERDRLRDGIREHRDYEFPEGETFTATHRFRQAMDANARLWALLDDREDADG